MNPSVLINLLLFLNLFVFLKKNSHTSLFFYCLLFLHTYIIALSCFASLYKHLFIYLLHIHSDERLQSETLESIIQKTVSVETTTQHSIYATPEKSSTLKAKFTSSHVRRLILLVINKTIWFWFLTNLWQNLEGLFLFQHKLAPKKNSH